MSGQSAEASGLDKFIAHARWTEAVLTPGSKSSEEWGMVAKAAERFRDSLPPSEPQGEPSDVQIGEARDAGKWMHLSIFGNTGPEDKHWWDIMRAALRAAGGVR